MGDEDLIRRLPSPIDWFESGRDPMIEISVDPETPELLATANAACPKDASFEVARFESVAWRTRTRHGRKWVRR